MSDEVVHDDAVDPADANDPTDRAAMLRAQARSGEAIPLSEFRKKSRRSFLTGAAGILGAGVFWNYVQTKSDPVDGIPGLLRNTLETNEAIWSNFQDRSAPEYAIADASPIQTNGRVGIREDLQLAGYTVRVEGPDGEVLDELPVDHFRGLPQRDMVIEHKCIEGWSNITHWRGARFRDFHEAYADRIGDAAYVGLATPDEEYYVGWDLDAILHPQTMLALEQAGEPLGERHGAPLRLATPNKYGIKCLKRIG
ncbi:molybdopterin-dependent oxidoreductase, partial [Ilumatobacter sp.]|uniref:molybdopterin-dependent oxidoreductase n=1 Tax=Ilumatobacter sp. TaxID=1967498 RepID=UPI003AF73A5B